jgi:hypothetical protein
MARHRPMAEGEGADHTKDLVGCQAALQLPHDSLWVPAQRIEPNIADKDQTHI